MVQVQPRNMSERQESEQPPAQGGSLLIAWQLKDKNVLIVGGGEVASQRIDSLLPTDANITVLSPAKGVCARTQQLVDAHPHRVTHYDRRFTGPAELHRMDMVLTAIDDVSKSREIVELCRKARIPVNAADIPDLCNFYFGAQVRDGPLQIMISTNGNGPKLAALIKERIRDSLTGCEGVAIEKVGQLRAMLRERAPGVGGGLGRRRMKWISSLCSQWQLEDLMHLDEATMTRLLDEGWEKNEVPTAAQLGVKRTQTYKKSAPDTSSAAPPTSAAVPILPCGLAFAAGIACSAAVFLLRGRR
ncbi:putative NAD(P)-binding-domain-containing protein [Schizophyllum commune]